MEQVLYNSVIAEFRKTGKSVFAVIKGSAAAIDETDWENKLYRTYKPKTKTIDFKAIPYYSWDNRSPGAMKVWVNES